MHEKKELFPDRLRRLREQRHMSRKTMSELCGLNPDAVRRYEGGEQKPGMDALIAMSDLLEVSIDYLVCNEYFRLHG